MDSTTAIGFLNLNKPPGWTSHDCVAKIRRSLQIKRVGHGGTLDPAATGILPIAIGQATRLLNYLPTHKAYRARIRLGMQTTTDDLEGEILATHATENLSLDLIRPQLEQFIGKIDQIPPAYSAIQQNGKRLYELARQGIVVEVPMRQVEIYEISILNWYSGEFLELELAIACGGGTYIRAIARDLGNILGVGGTLAALERTASCGMVLKDSLTLDQIQSLQQNSCLELISPAIALSHLPFFELSPSENQRWQQGQAIALGARLSDAVSDAVSDGMSEAMTVGCAIDSRGQLLGVGLLEPDTKLLRPKVVLK